jgi:hypothetical protein
MSEGYFKREPIVFLHSTSISAGAVLPLSKSMKIYGTLIFTAIIPRKTEIINL